MEGLFEKAERKANELLKNFPLSTVVMNILGPSLVKLERISKQPRYIKSFHI